VFKALQRDQLGVLKVERSEQNEDLQEESNSYIVDMLNDVAIVKDLAGDGVDN
jgi:hypothetical protein